MKKDDFNDIFSEEPFDEDLFETSASSQEVQPLNTTPDWGNLQAGCPEISPIIVDEICNSTGERVSSKWCDIEDIPEAFIGKWRIIAIEKIATDIMWAKYLDADHFAKIIQHQKGESIPYQYSRSHLSLSDEEREYLISDTLPASYQEFLDAGVDEKVAYKFALYEKFACYGLYEDTTHFVYPEASSNRFVEFPIRSLVTHDIIDYNIIYFKDVKTLPIGLNNFIIDSIHKNEKPYYTPLFIVNREAENHYRHSYDPFYTQSSVLIKPPLSNTEYNWNMVVFLTDKPTHFKVEITSSSAKNTWQEFDDVAYIPKEERANFTAQLLTIMATNPVFAAALNKDVFYQLEVKPHLLTTDQVNEFNHNLCNQHKNFPFKDLEKEELDYLHSEQLPEIYHRLISKGIPDPLSYQFALCAKLMKYSYFFDVSGAYQNEDYPYHLATVPIRSNVTFEQIALIPIKTTTELGASNTDTIINAIKRFNHLGD